MPDPQTQPSFVPRETRPCVSCREQIEPGAAYTVTARGPLHIRLCGDRGDDRPHVDLYPQGRPETFPGGP